jgi:hypothetical protein
MEPLRVVHVDWEDMMQLTKILMIIPAVAIVAAIGLAADQGQAPQAQAGEKDSAKSAAQQSAKPTGIAECDKYFAMVDACVASKRMSKEDQQAAEFNVSRLRAMLPIANTAQGRATLVDRCTSSIETGRKNDKTGCYTEPKKDQASPR